VFLEEKLPEMLEDIPLAWFQHDGAVDHFACHLPESLDLIPVDFFRWGYNKIFSVM
jgi:hypothetical protein